MTDPVAAVKMSSATNSIHLYSREAANQQETSYILLYRIHLVCHYGWPFDNVCRHYKLAQNSRQMHAPEADYEPA